MPALKKSDYEEWNNTMKARIVKGMEQTGKSDKEMYKLLGMSSSTWFRKKSEPALFDAYQLYQMKKALQLTAVDIMDIYRCDYKIQFA